MEIPFFRSLEASQRVLVAGCGGGFDVVSGLPLYVWLRERGKAVFLANLSFSRLAEACHERIGPSAWVIDPTCASMSYFPERHVAEWLAGRSEFPRLIGFEKTGVRPLQKSYEAVVSRFGIDTIILVDGGTDSLIKGDEALLGTVEEDAASIVAVDQLAGITKFLVCFGFGVDQYHGISNHSFLENTAEMIRSGGYLGSVSVVSGTPEGEAYLSAVDFLNERQPSLKSIVSNSIASAMRGFFGDYHATSRTSGTELYINALMTLYWCYDLASVAKIIGFYDAIVDSYSFLEVEIAVRQHHARVIKRDWKNLPL